MKYWYAVFCKPRGEYRAETNLRNQGYAVYLPRLLNCFWRSGKWAERIEPLFPRYLFLQQRNADQSLATVRSTLGVAGLVRFGEQLAVVPEAMIDALRAGEGSSSGAREEVPVFKAGAQVRFAAGPFAGLDAVFEKEVGVERAFVLLKLLGQFSRLRIDRRWLVLVD